MRKNIKHWHPSPLLVTGATAGLILLLIPTMNWLALRRERLTAQVEIAAPLITASETKTATVNQALPDGEVERTAIRVREVSAVVMGLTLCAVQEGLERRPVSQVEPLLERFVSRGLLPPGIKRSSASGVLVSNFALLYVRYRPDPLGVEIVSVPRGQSDGAMIIARIVTGESEASELFMARSGKVVLPVPFTPTAEIAARNWSLEPWREGNLSEPELEKISTWVRAQKTP